MYRIYLATNTVNDKYYVGQTSSTVGRRWQKHVYNSGHRLKKRCAYLWNAIQKYSSSAFELQELTSADTREATNNLERLWIIALRSYDPAYGYNLTFGGEGLRATPETRQKMSKSRKGMTFSDDHKRHISESKKAASVRPSNFRADIKTDEVVSLYRSGLSIPAVAQHFGCDQGTIWHRLKRVNEPRRSVGLPLGHQFSENAKQKKVYWGKRLNNGASA